VPVQLRAEDDRRAVQRLAVVRSGFGLDSEAWRANSLHKIDTLLAALQVFRKGLVDEFEQCDRRQRELDASRE
jgi:hypothetical protein